MEYASKIRWALVIIIGLLVLILVGWGLISIANSVFSGLDSSSKDAVVGSVDDSTVETAPSVRLIADGPTVYENTHRSYVIEVSEAVVSMKVYASYGQELLTEKSYTNTPEAYQAFLSALGKANVAARITGTDTEDDYNELGSCATGKRYIIEIGDNVRRWSTSCSSKQGTAGTSMSSIRTLFRKQVPDYSTLVRGTSL